MIDHPEFLSVQVKLTVTAGYCGIFPEPELLVWLRSTRPSPGKILVVEPRQPLASAGRDSREYRAVEITVSPERVKTLVEKLESIPFPGRALVVRSTSDPESTWWARAVLEVSRDDASAQLEFDFGPEGVRGPDAKKLRGTLHELLSCAGVDSSWSDVLGRPRGGEG